MIRNCIIYELGKDHENVKSLKSSSLSNVDIKHCVKSAKGSLQRRINELSNLARNEKLIVKKSNRDNFVFSCSCRFRTRKLIAESDLEPPLVPVEFDIWIRREKPVVITFDAGRRLSAIANILLSYAINSDPSVIKPIRLEKNTFNELINWLLSDQRGESGEITRTTMYWPEIDSFRFKQLVLNAPNLQSAKLFKESLKSAEGISNISFITPPLSSTSRKICCRLSNWGGLTIYTENPLSSEISELIKVLESLRSFPGKI